MPLDKLLDKLLESNRADLLLNGSKNAARNDNGFLKEFWDGDFSRDHPFLCRH
jgi:hypothetical protein